MRQFSGVCPALVVDNVDPDNSGRVQVRLPPSSVPGQEGLNAWARIATDPGQRWRLTVPQKRLSRFTKTTKAL